VSWRVAKSLNVLLGQVNAAWPSRSKTSDGSIASGAHTLANPSSDHEPWVPPPAGGVVTARDFTHDPKSGADMARLAETLRASKDPRIKYVIWDRRMFSSYPTSSSAAWTWRSYTGKNPHTAHLHVSVQPSPGLFDLSSPWRMPGVPVTAPPPKDEIMSPAQEAKLDKLAADVAKLAQVVGERSVSNDLRRLRLGVRALLAHAGVKVEDGP
jgi:hypothetical protein